MNASERGEAIERIEKRLQELDPRIRALEVGEAVQNLQISQVAQSLEKINKTLMWLVTLVFGTIIGTFLKWMVENAIQS